MTTPLESDVRRLPQKVSVVVPVYFNAGSLPTLYEDLSAVENQLRERGAYFCG